MLSNELINKQYLTIINLLKATIYNNRKLVIDHLDTMNYNLLRFKGKKERWRESLVCSTDFKTSIVKCKSKQDSLEDRK